MFDFLIILYFLSFTFIYHVDMTTLVYFGVSDKYFLNLQTDIDIRQAENSNQEEFNRIKAIQYA